MSAFRYLPLCWSMMRSSKRAAQMPMMAAAKALSTVQEWFTSTEHKSQEGEFRLDMANLWAMGEAAASLGFFAARLSDKLDEAEHPSSADAKLAALFSPAAKLFSSSSVAELLRQVAAWGDYGRSEEHT